MLVAARMLACIVAGLLVASGAPAAGAQTVADTVERWGLLGTWATECNRPPAPTNSYISYVRSGAGRVLYVQDLGGGRRTARRIVAASVSPDGLIEVIADFGKAIGVRRWRVVKGAGGRVRAMANSKIDGTGVTIRDGRFVHTGRESPWLSRCVRGGKLQEAHAACCSAARDDHGICPGPPA